MEKAKNEGFDSLVMGLLSQGWRVKNQVSTTVVLSKTVGVNGWIATALMLIFSLLGMIAVLIWIAVAGEKTLNLQYEGHDYLATISNKDLIARIRSPQEIDPFLQEMKAGFKVSYGAAIGIGIISMFINVALSLMFMN